MNMNILERSFRGLYPDNIDPLLFEVKYSAKFSGFNANIRRKGYKITISLSRKWLEVSEDIQIGLCQHLLNRLYNTKIKTTEMELYTIFLKRVHVSIEKNNIDERLKESFDRMNLQFFLNLLETTNLVWGEKNFRKLGSYTYGTDTIMVSSVLKDAPQELIDLVVYHEMLHKKHKFYETNSKTMHHSSAFKADERKFPDFINAEKRLTQFLRRKRFGRLLSWF